MIQPDDFPKEGNRATSPGDGNQTVRRQHVNDSTTKLRPTEQFDRDWLGSIVRPVLIVLMVSSVSITVLAFLRQYALQMPVGVRWSVAGMGVLAAIIGVATTTWLAMPAQRLRRSAGYRLAEIVLLIAAARMILWLASGALPSPLLLLNDPLSAFADGIFLFALVTILFTWYAAIDFTDDLTRMALQPDELWINQRANVRFADSARPAPTNRTAILRGFVARWVSWGIVLILLASTLRMGITRPGFWGLTRMDVDPLVVGAILLYFLIGLLLISQGQLAVLRARWTIDRLPTAPAIIRNWPIYTFLVILVFGVIAAFLPLGDTYLLSLILGAILNILFGLVFLLFRLITLAFLMLLSLLPFSNQNPQEALPPPAQNVFEQPPTVLAIPAWVSGAFFWLSVVALLGYAAYFYFSDKDASMAWLRRIWRRIVEQWRALFGAAQHWYRQRQQLADDESASPVKSPGMQLLRRLMPWRLLNPEQRVRFLYFQLLEHGEKVKVGRLPAETPACYAPRLESTIDATNEDVRAIDELTGAFIDVRYAGRQVESQYTERLRALWIQLRSKLVSKDAEDQTS
jgi:hypothetical protein